MLRVVPLNASRVSSSAHITKTMATSRTMPDIESLELSYPETEDLFASPSRPKKKADADSKAKDAEGPNATTTSHTTWNGESRYDNEEAREALLRRELESVRNINQVMEGVVESLERAKGNMEVAWSFEWAFSIAC